MSDMVLSHIIRHFDAGLSDEWEVKSRYPVTWDEFKAVVSVIFPLIRESK